MGQFVTDAPGRIARTTDDRTLGRFQSDISLTGRVLVAIIFLVSGIGKLANFTGTVAYMESKGMGAAPIFAAAAAIVEIGGATLLITGYRTRGAGALLLAYLIPVTVLFHAFWNVGDMERQNQMAHFMKNLAIMGGLAYVVAFGAPSRSVDGRRVRRTRGPREEFGSHPTHPIHGM